MKQSKRSIDIDPHPPSQNSWLDRIDRRYSWIKKTLTEFEEKFGKIFPAHWDMSERLAVEFCEITKLESISFKYPLVQL